MWNWTRKHRQEKQETETDFGRRYGWILLHEGRPVAELGYVRWDEATQFWHSYAVRWLESGSLSSIPSEKWQESGFVLRNKKYPQIEFSDYMVALANDGTVLLRGPYVPGELLVT
jgi:hypothetical protein